MGFKRPDRMPDLLERVVYFFNGTQHSHWIATWKGKDGNPDQFEAGFLPVHEHFFYYRQQPDGSFKLVGLS